MVRSGGTASGVVYYDNTATPYGTVFSAAAKPHYALDDIRLTPGPGAGQRNVYTDTHTLGWTNPQSPLNSDLRVRFWDNVVYGPADPVNSALFAEYVLEIRDWPPGTWAVTVDVGPVGGVTFPDDFVGFELRFNKPGSQEELSDDATVIFPKTDSGPVVGSSADVYWRDADGNGRYNSPPDDRSFDGPPFLANFYAAFASSGRVCDPCDANCDGSIDGLDIGAFVSVLKGGPRCDGCVGDVNADGSVNAFDIAGFVECLESP